MAGTSRARRVDVWRCGQWRSLSLMTKRALFFLRLGIVLRRRPSSRSGWPYRDLARMILVFIRGYKILAALNHHHHYHYHHHHHHHRCRHHQTTSRRHVSPYGFHCVGRSINGLTDYTLGNIYFKPLTYIWTNQIYDDDDRSQKNQKEQSIKGNWK